MIAFIQHKHLCFSSTLSVTVAADVTRSKPPCVSALRRSECEGDWCVEIGRYESIASSRKRSTPASMSITATTITTITKTITEQCKRTINNNAMTSTHKNQPGKRKRSPYKAPLTSRKEYCRYLAQKALSRHLDAGNEMLPIPWNTLATALASMGTSCLSTARTGRGGVRGG